MQLTNFGDNVEKREPSYTVGGSVNWCSHWKIVYRILQKLQIYLIHDPAIPLLKIYAKKIKTLIQKHSCTPIFIAALFILAKVWKQPKSPSTDEQIKM